MHKTNQKVKLLLLYDLLTRLTDEQHPLSTKEIIKLLSQQGIKLTRKILPSDILTLNLYGFEVMSFQDKSNYYYVRESRFDSAEVRLMMELVAAAKLPMSHKTDMLERLVGMTKTRQAEFLTKNVIYDYVDEFTPKTIVYALDVAETAIRTGKKVSFLYYRLGSHKEKNFENDRARYVVNPLVILFKNGVHYLIAYDDEYKGLDEYRLDRMDQLCLEPANLVPCLEYKNGDLESYRGKILDTFVGKEEEIKLRFDEDLLEAVYDKIGQGIDVKKAAKNTYRAFATVRLTREFFAWIVASGGKMKLEGSDAAVKQFAEFVSAIKENY